MTTSVGEHRTGWVADDSTFGARLALIRQRMAWGNLKEAADACGLPVESWRRWERDGRAPRDVVEIASTISERTGCDFGWLLAGSRLRRRSGVTETFLPTKIVSRRPMNRRISTRPGDGRPIGHPSGSIKPDGSTRTSRVAERQTYSPYGLTRRA